MIDVNNIDSKFQFDLINIQIINSLKKAITENDLLTFYKKYIKIEEYPNLFKARVLASCSIWQYTCFNNLKISHRNFENIKIENIGKYRKMIKTKKISNIQLIAIILKFD